MEATRQAAAARGEEIDMRVIGIVVLAAGILALAYGGFSYTRQTHDAKVGPLEFSFSEKQRVNVPVWAGVVLAVAGGALLLRGKK
jgi:hypothetical protein